MSGVVCVVGSLNVDLVTRVRRHPRPGETVVGDRTRTFPGGKGANQALAAARAGARTRLVGRVGADSNGTAYLAGLGDRGVDCSAVLVTPGEATGSAIVVVDEPGENSIIVSPGANGFVRPADVDAAAVRSADVLLLQLELPPAVVRHAAELAAQAGIKVVLNASPWSAAAAELVDLADVVIVNEHEAAALGPVRGSVCETLGSRGARWLGAERPAPVIEAVDTTGAGDAFAGTFAAHLAMAASPDRALRSAIAAGAAACGHAGAQGWALTR
ncbi:ribokinase [Kribbella speibonae]|uniref:Ribokinase n=1 Tax=Kribbella speibonae TaxID=1572660 RepID=A0A4R0IU32_9ACTN|nr:ribokinase [Kribbella speibonae]TCC36250.1 ribokinase [Kribbella speibonae]